MLTEQNYENDTQESNETVVPSENQESLSEDKDQDWMKQLKWEFVDILKQYSLIYRKKVRRCNL